MRIKRDHRKHGREIGILHSHKNFYKVYLFGYLNKSTRDKLEIFIKKYSSSYGNIFQYLMTPHIGNKDLYVCSGQLNDFKYGEDSFQPIKTPNREKNSS